jgi:ABC-type multidrug transport system fused ATPase/permease subunit
LLPLTHELTANSSSQDSDDAQPRLVGYFIAVLYIVVLLLSVTSLAWARTLFFRIGCSFRAALLQATYHKALVAHVSTIAAVGPGQLSSFMSVDIERIVQAAELPTALIELPVVIILGLVIIWRYDRSMSWEGPHSSLQRVQLAIVLASYCRTGHRLCDRSLHRQRYLGRASELLSDTP